MSDREEAAAIDDVMDESVPAAATTDDNDNNNNSEIIKAKSNSNSNNGSVIKRRPSISRLSIRSANLEQRGRRHSRARSTGHHHHHVLTDKRSVQQLRRLQRATTQAQIVVGGGNGGRRLRRVPAAKTISSADIDNNKNESNIKQNEELAKSLELLQLVDDETNDATNAEAGDNNRALIDQSSGDFGFEEEAGACAAAAAAATVETPRPRSVQWKGDVDVIYYAGDRRGKLIRRENEPLREESDQQARKNRYVQLALAKSLFSNVATVATTTASSCHLRGAAPPNWLAEWPK